MPLYRLAEAYLLKAEAANGMDDIATATAALNEVAKRARGIDEYYKNLDKRGVTEAIINESKMEFVAEGKMWWLYLRTNTEFELISTLVGREGEKNVTLWPVANVCITTNPRIEQTEGYK
jgi:Zn/Cd-binding protein ZinT